MFHLKGKIAFDQVERERIAFRLLEVGGDELVLRQRELPSPDAATAPSALRSRAARSSRSRSTPQR